MKRASRLTVRGQLPGTGEQVEFATDAFEARALQHEIDHTDGFLFLDRVAGAHAIYPPARPTYRSDRSRCGPPAPPVSQLAEEADLNSAQSGFESRRGHLFCPQQNSSATRPAVGPADLR